jgi:hypothetical protein
MSTSARVDSIDSIKDFRVYLLKFQEMANLALGDAESDINRTMTWLEGEQTNYWMSQIRERQELLARAEEALRSKRLYKDVTGSMQPAVEEQKAVTTAKNNLHIAEQKLANVKASIKKLQKEMTTYRGKVANFSNLVNAGVLQAIAQLGGTIEMLGKYASISLTPAKEGAEATAGVAAVAPDGISMKRAVEELPKEEPSKEVNPMGHKSGDAADSSS